MLSKQLVSFSLPINVSNSPSPAEVVAQDLPVAVPISTRSAFTLQVRNTTGETWRKGQSGYRLEWETDKGEALLAGDLLPLTTSVAPGELLLLSGNLPRAPQQPGWYNIALILSKNKSADIKVTSLLQQVVTADLRAEVVQLTFPPSVSSYNASIPARVVLANRGLTDWIAGKTRLSYHWLSSNGVPLPAGAGFVDFPSDVLAGDTITLHPSLTPPHGAGAVRCLFGVECDGQPAVLLGNPASITMPVATTQLNSERFQTIDISAFSSKDTWASYPVSSITHYDFDGAGHAFPSETFLPDYASPSGDYSSNDTDGDTPTFHFNHLNEGRAPVMMAAGQQVPLPQRPSSALYLVALATKESHSASFTVRYLDGTEKTTNLAISYWMEDPSNNEPVFLTSRFLHTSTIDNWYLKGRLFVYKIPLNPNQLPTSLILPLQSDSPIAIFAVTLESPPLFHWEAATGNYTEWSLPRPDLSSLAKDYNPTNWWIIARQLAEQTYPAGARLLDWEGANSQLRSCWGKDATRATIAALVKNLPVAVQSCFNDYSDELQSECAQLAATNDGNVLQWRAQARFALAPTPDLDIVYHMPLYLPNAQSWPTRGSISVNLPDFMKSNSYYQQFFVAPTSSDIVKQQANKQQTLAELNFFEVLDAYNNALHHAMAALPLGTMPEQMRDVASLQLLSVLYLRQLEANAPLFAQICENKEVVTVFLLLNDRANYALASAESAHLADISFLTSIRAELLKPENTAVIIALRKALGT